MTGDHYALFDSPVGTLWVTANPDGVTSLHMLDDAPSDDRLVGFAHAPGRLSHVRDQLDAYFAGERYAFDLKLVPQGTPFQRSVWAQLERIPFGTTASYGEIARRIGNPKAMRAVGMANNANPISIIIPCHRVIGADGSLVGFGAGLARKRALLAHESGQQVAPEQTRFNFGQP
ncbi:MAG: methylated-DNA--[protein]-cysteine S-methyltransferase [Myxococcota bacterium]